MGDLFLARADSATRRFYSLSAQIQRQSKQYYDVLERTQKGDLLAALGRHAHQRAATKAAQPFARWF